MSTKLSYNVQPTGELRKEWDIWLRRYKDSIRQVAARAGVDYTQLFRSINAGVASETIRSALAAIDIPEHLIPLPTCPRTLAGIVYRQQQEILQLQQKK